MVVRRLISRQPVGPCVEANFLEFQMERTHVRCYELHWKDERFSQGINFFNTETSWSSCNCVCSLEITNRKYPPAGTPG